MKVLVDTNIVIDALAVRHPWAEMAQDVLRAAARGKIRAFLTASQVTDIFYLLRRSGMSETEARDALKKLTSVLVVASVTPGDVDEALSSSIHNFEDALLACCAAHHRATYIVTRNERDFQQSIVPALAPSALLNLMD